MGRMQKCLNTLEVLSVPDGYTYCYANFINNLNQVVGTCHEYSEPYRAFLWNAEREIVDLETLPGESYPGSSASSITNQGQI